MVNLEYKLALKIGAQMQKNACLCGVVELENKYYRYYIEYTELKS